MYQIQYLFVFMVQLSFCCNITVFTQPHTVLLWGYEWNLITVCSCFCAQPVPELIDADAVHLLHKHMLIPERVLLFHCCTWLIATEKKKALHTWFLGERLLIRCLLSSVWVKVIGVMLTCNMTNLGQCNHPPPFTTTGYKRQDWKKQRRWGYHHQALCVNVCMWK